MSPLKILYVEDSQADVELVSRILNKAGIEFSMKVVEAREAFLNELQKQPPDLVLSDHKLPQFDSKEALSVFKDLQLSIPFILVTGTVSEEFAVEIVKSGADDYILKDRLTRLPSAIRQAIAKKQIESERKRIEQENKLILTLLDRSSDEIYVFDPLTFRIQYANRGSITNTGYTGEELKSMTIVDVISGDDRSAFMHLLKPVQNKETDRVVLEAHHKRADGTVYPIESHLQFLEVEDRLMFLCIVRDITERKAADRQIHETNERYEAVARATNDAIYDWDIENDEVYWGEGVNTLFGHDWAGKKISLLAGRELAHPDDQEEVIQSLKAALTDEGVRQWNKAYRFKKADGSFAFVLSRGIIMRKADGTPKRMVGALQDISEQKQHEQVLSKLNAELQKKADALVATNAELEQFAYTASHDLKEPLRMISSFMQLLEKNYAGQLDDKAKKYIHFAVDASQRMTRLINELLEYSRVGKDEAEENDIDLNILVRDITKTNQAALETQNARVQVDRLPLVTGMATPLRMVFNNLISNALKYTRDGVAPEIFIGVEEEPDTWKFFVRDNGIGIAPEYHAHIFQLFKRLHTNEAYAGSGMGLAICKKIVEQHGGKIWVQSTPDAGSTFYFTLKK